MGRSERWRGALVAVVFLLCVCCLLVAMVATDPSSLGPGAAAAYDLETASSPAEYPGGRAFRSSKRRIPKGPDPIHNRAELLCHCHPKLVESYNELLVKSCRSFKKMACREDGGAAAERLAGARPAATTTE